MRSGVRDVLVEKAEIEIGDGHLVAVVEKALLALKLLPVDVRAVSAAKILYPAGSVPLDQKRGMPARNEHVGKDDVIPGIQPQREKPACRIGLRLYVHDVMSPVTVQELNLMASVITPDLLARLFGNDETASSDAVNSAILQSHGLCDAHTIDVYPVFASAVLDVHIRRLPEDAGVFRTDGMVVLRRTERT